MNTRTLEDSAIQIRASRLDMLSRLADDIAHEIKNPLHAMVIHLELLKCRVADGKTQDALERADALREEVTRLHQLVDALLALFRPSRHEVEDVSMGGVLQELAPALELQARLARVDLCIETTPLDDRVRIAPDALKQAVLNLVSNALLAVQPAGGRLELVVAGTGLEVSLHLRDTGPTLAAQDFEGRGKADASQKLGPPARGLTVARHIAAEAGGRIELEDPGGPTPGDRVRLVLPRPPDA